jgi:small subunit ribosomal protein S16
MLMIRFQRVGRRNDPAFRIVVLEKERAAKAGNIVELLGTYNPRSKALTLNEQHVREWMAKGAQPTDSIRNLLINKKVIEGKKVNVLPKKTPQKKQSAETAATAAEPLAQTSTVDATPLAAEVTSETPVEVTPVA